MRVFKVIRPDDPDAKVGKFGLTLGKLRMAEDIPPQMERVLRMGWWTDMDELGRMVEAFDYRLVFDGETQQERSDDT